MIDRRDEMFKTVFSSQTAEAHEASRQAGFEHTLVKRILASAGFAPTSWPLVSQQCFEQTDSRQLSFRWLHQNFQFPMQLGSAKIGWAHRTTVYDLFRRFSKTLVFGGYKDFLERSGLDDRDAKVGFIFEMGKLGTMVLHNYPRTAEMGAPLDEQDPHGTYLVRPFGRPVVVYVVEELRTLLAAIGPHWLSNA